MAAKQEPAEQAIKQEPAKRDYYIEARLLIRKAKSATLATASAGIPNAALVTPAFFPNLTPVLLLSQLSAHTRQLQANPACALLVVGTTEEANPQTAPRICLSGVASLTTDPAARIRFLDTHPYANLYADFADFNFWRLELTSAHYIGGFAAACQLDIAKLCATT